MTKIESLKLDLGAAEEAVLKVLQSSYLPLSSLEIRAKVERKTKKALSELDLKRAIKLLEQRGYDIKAIVSKDITRYSLVRYVEHKEKKIYRPLGKIEIPVVFSSDWHVGCLPKEQLISYGETVGEIKEFQRVLSNSETTVLRTFAREPYPDEYLVTIKPMSILPVKLTDLHPVYCIRGQRRNNMRVFDGKPDFYPADMLREGDWVAIPKIKGKKTFLRLEPTKTHKRATKFAIDKELAYFLGFYVGDGYVYKSRNTYRIGICFALKDNKERILNLIKERFRRKVYLIKRHNCIEAIFIDKALGAYLMQLGKSRSKRIPKEILKSSKAIASSFLEGLIDADGWRFTKHGKKVYSLTTTSKVLAYQLPLLLAKLGLMPNIQIVPSKVLPTSKVGFRREAYHIEITLSPVKKRFRETKDFIWLPIVSIEKQPLKEIVYDIQTTTSTFAMPIMVHNSTLFSEQAFFKLVDYVKEHKIKHIVSVGDLIQGLGVYRIELADLLEPSIDSQVDLLEDYLRMFPKNVKIHMTMGGHEEKLKGKWKVGYDALRDIAMRLPNVYYYGSTVNLIVNNKWTLLGFHSSGVTMYATTRVESIYRNLPSPRPNILVVGHRHQLFSLPKIPDVLLVESGTLQRESSYLLFKGYMAQLGWVHLKKFSREYVEAVCVKPEVY